MPKKRASNIDADIGILPPKAAAVAASTMLPDYRGEGRTLHQKYCFLCSIGKAVLMMNEKRMTDSDRYVRDVVMRFTKLIHGVSNEADIEDVTKRISVEYASHAQRNPHTKKLQETWTDASIRFHVRQNLPLAAERARDLNTAANLATALQTQIFDDEGKIDKGNAKLLIEVLRTRAQAMALMEK